MRRRLPITLFICGILLATAVLMTQMSERIDVVVSLTLPVEATPAPLPNRGDVVGTKAPNIHTNNALSHAEHSPDSTHAI